MNRLGFVYILMIVCLLTGSLIGAAIGPRLSDTLSLDKPKTPVLPTPPAKIQEDKAVNDEPVVSVAKRVRKSVVNIKVKTRIKYPQNLFSGSPEEVQGIGSGVVIRSDGYIITNSHVVEDANEISVILDTGDEFSGKVVGFDSDSDIAIVKINRKNLPAAAIVTSKNLQVGSMVVAVGSPWELEHTVTAGIVSALGRNISVPAKNGKTKHYSNLIQTDAAINPGNSGGALTDKAGNVVGINTLIYSQSGGYEGVGFAIPIEEAIDVANQLIAQKKIKKPYIGLYVRDISENFSKKNGIKKGAVVTKIVTGSPAAKAGLQKNDIVVSINEQKIDNMDDMIAVIRRSKVNQKIKMVCIRGKTKIETTVHIAEKV